jgi:hypothetical protein
MNGPNELAMDESDDDWFAQGELEAAPEAAPDAAIGDRRSRVGVLVAAISATALALLMILAGRV